MPTPAPLLPPPLSDAELARLDRLVAQMVHGEATATEWPAHDLAHAVPRLLAEIRRLRAALAGWKCYDCHGKGKITDDFHQLYLPAERDPCVGCAGSGLHPAARAALGDDAGAGGAK